MIRIINHGINLIQSKIREKKKSKERSPEWNRVRDRFLKEKPFCASCGGKKELQVHHIEPFHVRPDLELDYSNLVVLCMGRWDCHIKIGHGSSFKFFNKDVIPNATEIKNDPKSRHRIEKAAKLARIKMA
jgi:hypothetical protein